MNIRSKKMSFNAKAVEKKIISDIKDTIVEHGV